MVRATSSPASRRSRKRTLKQAKGFWGDRKNHIRQAKNAVMSAMSFHTCHRKLKKSEFRSLWITRVGVGAKLHGLSYSKMMCGLKRAGCLLNRKMLSEMAIHDPEAFGNVADIAKKALAS
ncbi:MAG: 50S ribosomal protein L20 [Verrucomicrobia bacterium]|nr:50S ribosomal protein L20 [Verrucomicrobiota bacterium]MBS0647493.1 50S ribosomal protein L20 [Verrucomicrobiota bacterium]